ncbi:MAG TPA: hypothetical protein VFI25_14590 [Planctomycetota bacterium]|nr:hypothetical protein [Planctomycetota bacterium]
MNAAEASAYGTGGEGEEAPTGPVGRTPGSAALGASAFPPTRASA